MKKALGTVFLMFIAVVAGVAIRYYMQTGSFLPKEQPTQAEQAADPDVNSEDVKTPEPDVISEDAKTSKPDNEWGVVLTAEDVTPDGMTLVCRQSGGSPTGELSTGPWYEIEMLEGEQWKPAPVYAEVCWEDVAWIIAPEETTRWELNWTWIYGTLPEGEYRISKEIMDFRKTGDFDTCRSYAYFTIEG